jgi:1-acyl-sn-glycerol-3-phosphate acyltransferase
MTYIVSVLIYLVALVVFLFIAITTIICTYLFKPVQYDKFVKFLCRLLLRCMLIRVTTCGIENFNHKKAYLFMSNHVNILDVFILNGYIPSFARGIEQEQHFSWFLWGKVITRFGNIPIHQKKLKRALASLTLAEEALSKGISIIILPEGHRTRTGEMLPFMRGPFLLAQKTKADIVPLAIAGAFEIKKTGHWLIKPGTVKLIFGEVITHQETKHLPSKELKELVRDKIQHLLQTSN